MSLIDFMALHDLAVEAGVIVPFMFSIDMLGEALPARNTPDQMAAFYAFARETGLTESQAKAAYRFAAANA